MTGSGLKYPTISIGGKAYELRLSLGAFYRLEEDGLPADKLAAEMQSWMPEVGKDGDGNEIVVRPPRIRILTLMQVLRACMGSHTTLTAEQIADELDMSDLPVVAQAVAEACSIALSKMKPSMEIPLRESAAAQERAQ